MLYRFKSVLIVSMAFLMISSFIPAGRTYADISESPSPVIPEESTFFSTAFVEEGSTYNTASDGDLWPSAWSDDDNLYLANGDGDGWTSYDNPATPYNDLFDIAFSKITSGHPDTRNLTGERVSQEMGQVWSNATCSATDTSPAYNRKPTGLTSSGGVLWMAVQDLNRCPAGVKFYEPMFNDAPNATILKSDDKGVTWTWDTQNAMFPNHEFTTIFFLDWGKDGVDNKPNSDMDDYIYAYGMDYNWRDSFSDTVPDPTKLFLARILATDNVQDLSKWQFWTGGLKGGKESWSNPGDFSARKPVLQDDRKVYSNVVDNFPAGEIKDMTTISQGSVTYNKALDRFIYLSWTEYTFEFYESPTPWGPWKRFISKDMGVYPWAVGKNGGYTTVMPSKYISEDGEQMWFNANSFMGNVNNYNYSLRKLHVTPYHASLTPDNAKNNTDNLAMTGENRTPISGASVHQGKPFAFIDGDKTAGLGVDDWNGDSKTQSYWGVTWSKPYNLNKVVFTNGNTYGDGGYFGNDIKVQVRQNFQWVDVSGSTVSPQYPADGSAANKTYTFQFANTWGDGVRIIGTAGGVAHFTSISELEAYYFDPTGGEPFELIGSKAVKVARVTGATKNGETIPNPNHADVNWAVYGTDLGIMWDATTTANPNEKKTMVLFGDSYDSGWKGEEAGLSPGSDPAGWRSNLLALSNDTNLSDGLTFSSMIADPATPNFAKQIIDSAHDTSGSGDFTAIPTAGVTVGDRHYIHYMQIKNWGANGRWNTNFSELAYSDDDGQNWAKSGVQWGSTSKFAQAAYVKDGGYVYMFGTPAGRFDGAYLARVTEADMLDKSKYEYWNGSGWSVNNEADAVIVVDAPVSELSVARNTYYDKWIMTYLNEDRASIIMRSSSGLTSGWSAESEIAKSTDFPDLYGGFIHPWTNNGTDLYFLMSQWKPYNVFLMRSKLQIGSPVHNLVADPFFEKQPGGTISNPWVLESGNGGIDKGSFSRSGSNNVWLRSGGGWNAIKQTVPVNPNTEYRLKAFVKTSTNNNAGFFGVRNSDGSILNETPFSRHDNYSPLTVQFNSGSNTSVTIFTGMHATGDTWIQADDYYLLPVDKTPPVINLNGNATVNVPIGSTFTDPGAMATDNVDVDISHKISVSGTVDTSTLGTYTVTYNVSDSEMNAAVPVTRTVNVVSSNNNLSALSLSVGTLSPVFDAGTLNYSASVGNAVYDVIVTPTVADSTAVVTVNGVEVASGNASNPISLTVGFNTINVVVTAEDTSTKQYTINVTREYPESGNLVADPSFEMQPGTAISAPWVLESGNGGIDKGGRFSRSDLNNVWLRNAGGWNALRQTIPVTPNTEYRLKAFVRTSANNSGGYFGVRNANGSILQEINFANFENYSPLTVQFNSGSNTSVTIFTGMHAVGDTWVQADDYSLLPVVSTNNDLSALSLSAGTLNPVFDTGTTDYTATVGNAVYSLTVTSTVYDSTASVTVNGEAVASGHASNPISLAVGSNTINIVVTAQDTSTKHYTINVTRESAVTIPSDPSDTSSDPSTDTSSGSDQVTETGIHATVNGQQGDIAQTSTANIAGQTVLTANMDAAKLHAYLSKEGDKPVIAINAVSKVDKVSVVLTGDLVKAMANKQAVLEIRTPNGNYKLPASKVLIDQVSNQFGDQVSLSNIVIHVDIAKSGLAEVKLAENSAVKGKYSIVVPPVDFSIIASFNGQNVNVDKFNSYVEREIPLPNGTDPRGITTAIVLETDGTTRHVPTFVTSRDGKYVAVINSLTNSVYTLIRNSKTFMDVEQHWAKEAVNDLASRMVINGVDQTHFQPDAAMTRAELSAIIVRALGLADHGATTVFRDVKSGDWYSGAVAKALEYGIIQGYEDGTFKPLKTISREEAMVMIHRAMKITGMETAVNSSDVEFILSKFSDGSSVAPWAKQAISAAVKSEIVNGSNAGLQPQNDIKRAEMAVLVQRMLKTSKLIDSRN